MKSNRVEQVNYVFLFTVLVYIGASYLLSAIAESFQIRIPTFAAMLYSQVVLALPAVIYIKRNGIKPLESVRCKKVNVITVLLLILFGFMIRPVMGLLSAVSMLWAKNTISNTANQLITEVNFGLALVFIAIIPAILEEFVYRGIFYNEYRKVNTGKAILLSGLLFGLLHMNLNQFIYAFFMGVIFALIIEATDSILASVIVHFTINGGSMILLRLSNQLTDQLGGEMANTLEGASLTRQQILSMLPQMFVSAILFLGISLLIYIGIVKYNGRTEHVKSIFKRKETHGDGERLMTVPLIGAIVICVIFIVADLFV